MYEPNVRVTSILMDHLGEIEEVCDLLRTIPVLPIVEEPIQRKALVETVHYTTRIEGNPLDIRAVERLATLQSSISGISGKEVQEVVNLYDAMEFVKHVAAQRDVPINEDVIKQIHAFVVRDIPSEGPPAVYKTEPNAIIDEVTKERIFIPPSPNDTPKLMADLAVWLSKRPLAFHAIIAAALAHLELVAIHPFSDGNGRTARALADLVLYRYGYTFRYLFSWVRQVGIDMATYHHKLREVLGPKYGANTDPTGWLEYFAEAVAKSLKQEKPVLLRMREVFVRSYNAGEKAGWTRDQVEAVIYAVINGSITTGVYMNAKKLARSTVVKRLTELVEAGIMQVNGKGRNVHYALTPEFLSGMEQEKTD